METPSPNKLVTDFRLKRQWFKPVILTLATIILLLAVFRLGMFVGFRKASFSYRWSDNYHQMFAGPRRGFFDDFEGKGFTNAHGIFGSVLRVEPSAIVMKDKDNVEKTVTVSSSTSIRLRNEDIALSRLAPNDRLVIIGEPDDDGEIEAKFIRVFPKP